MVGDQNTTLSHLDKTGGLPWRETSTRWIENGKKTTKYFFNLEKRNYEKKIITQPKTTDGEIISDMTKINKEIP